MIMLVLQGFEDGVGVVRLRKSWMGDEISSDESLDDDELSLMVLLKQQGFTLILVVFLDDSDEVLDLVISILWLARILRLREVMVLV